MPSQRNARTICTKQYGRASVVHAIVRQSSPSLTVPCAPPTSGPRRCRYCWGYSPHSRSRSHSHSPAVLHAGARCAAKSARDALAVLVALLSLSSVAHSARSCPSRSTRPARLHGTNAPTGTTSCATSLTRVAPTSSPYPRRPGG